MAHNFAPPKIGSIFGDVIIIPFGAINSCLHLIFWAAGNLLILSSIDVIGQNSSFSNVDLLN